MLYLKIMTYEVEWNVDFIVVADAGYGVFFVDQAADRSEFGALRRYEYRGSIRSRLRCSTEYVIVVN